MIAPEFRGDDAETHEINRAEEELRQPGTAHPARHKEGCAGQDIGKRSAGDELAR